MSDFLSSMLETIADLAEGNNGQNVSNNNKANRNMDRPKQKNTAAKANSYKSPEGYMKPVKADTSSQYHDQHKNNSQEKVHPALDLSGMSGDDVLRGVVFSEILGKPKAMRRGRW